MVSEASRGSMSLCLGGSDYLRNSSSTFRYLRNISEIKRDKKGMAGRQKQSEGFNPWEKCRPENGRRRRLGGAFLCNEALDP